MHMHIHLGLLMQPSNRFITPQEGEGTYHFPDGRKYSGQWSNDQKHGQGTMEWPDGCAYTGAYIKDLRDGKARGKGWGGGRGGVYDILSFSNIY